MIAPSAGDANESGSSLPMNMTIIAPGDHGSQPGSDDVSGAAMGRRLLPRRISKAATLFAIAALCGAVGGAAAATAVSHFLTATAQLQIDTSALRDSVARLETDFASLRTNFDKVGKARTAQLGKVGDRLEKLEKSYEESSAKITKVNENLDKARAAMSTPAVTSKPVADVTGSIAKPVPKPEVKGQQIVQDWVLNRVSRGGALVEGERGLFEVYPGDPLPGLGRVEAVRYQDGRWVVVTQRGLIVRP